jgi:hypothetical protein
LGADILRVPVFDQHFLQHVPPPIANQVVNITEGLIAIAVALVLMFMGRLLIKMIAFIAVGLILGEVGAFVGGSYFGPLGLVVGALGGFLIGGTLSLVILPLAIGFAAGLLAYDLSGAMTSYFLISVMIGIIFFALGVVLSSQMLSVATAVFGGIIFLDALLLFGVPFLVAAIASLGLAILGFWAQKVGERAPRKPIAVAAVAQTS